MAVKAVVFGPSEPSESDVVMVLGCCSGFVPDHGLEVLPVLLELGDGGGVGD